MSFISDGMQYRFIDGLPNDSTKRDLIATTQ